jgi:putative addiction module component (TIGR02574 family)
MPDTNTTTALSQLPVAERLKLIEELWDSLDAEVDSLPLAEWQREEIDNRIDALDSGVSVGAPWDEVRRRITGQS